MAIESSWSAFIFLLIVAAGVVSLALISVNLASLCNIIRDVLAEMRKEGEENNDGDL